VNDLLTCIDGESKTTASMSERFHRPTARRGIPGKPYRNGERPMVMDLCWTGRTSIVAGLLFGILAANDAPGQAAGEAASRREAC
jgi:hypothetical protein